MNYRGSCHCGAVRFELTSEELTSGIRCNCSICIRKGIVMSKSYYRESAVTVQGAEGLIDYQFGDHSVSHLFCGRCGIAPFNRVTSLPPDYEGAARVGDHRVNLGCVEGVDATSLPIELIDGRSF